MITIVGLGIEQGDLTEKGKRAILSSQKVLLRTELAASAESVKALGVKYESLDYLYEKSRNFDTLQKNIAKEVLKAAKEGDVCYLVDGAVSEDSASVYIRKKAKVQIIDGVSKASHFASLASLQNYTSVSAYDVTSLKRKSLPLIVYDLDSVYLASDVKLTLSSLFGEEIPVTMIHGSTSERICLYEIDHGKEYDYRTALVIEELPLLNKERFDYTDLEDLVKLLRAPNGCPWDRVQTNETIKGNVVEEAYELYDAIESEDDDHILEEVGDVLLQSVFHSVIKEDESVFNSLDVMTAVSKKLIFRHSHIFGKDKAEGDQEALGVWEKNKRVEKGQQTFSETVNDVPKAFPSLLRAQKITKRAAKSGLDFTSKEEAKEEAIKALSKEQLGKALFYLASYARLSGEDGEFALKEEIDSFQKVFEATEQLVLKDGKEMDALDRETLLSYYRRAKC